MIICLEDAIKNKPKETRTMGTPIDEPYKMDEELDLEKLLESPESK